MDIFSGDFLILAIAFLAVAVPVFMIGSGRREDVRPRTVADRADENMISIYRMLWGPIVALEYSVGRPIAAMRPAKVEELENLIETSALDLTPSKVFTLQTLLAVAGAAVGFAFASALPGILPDYPKELLLAGPTLFMAFVGWAYPVLALQSFVENRKEELVRSLPFAIDLISSAMRAGLEFGAAMRYYVGLEMKTPLTDEFATVLRQIELGKTRVEALKLMASRLRIEAFTSFVGVIAYGTEIGASISDTLMVHGEELRRARFHLAERKAQRAPSLMIIPMAMFIMPAVFVIIITPVMMQMKMGGH